VQSNPDLVSLDGLGNEGHLDDVYLSGNGALSSIAALGTSSGFGSFWIAGNASLTSLDGLETATELERLDVLDNPELLDIDGLRNVTTTGPLTIQNNDALPSVAGLVSLTRAYRVTIGNNNALESVELPALAAVEGFSDDNLIISGNLVLERLRGISALERIGGKLIVTYNPALPTCEAEWLRDQIPFKGLAARIQGNDDEGTCLP
jgi:hypothetical protein